MTGVQTCALPISLAAWQAGSGEGGSSLLGDVGLILMLLFAVQGLAVAHERVRATGGRRGWLTGLYFVAGFVPQVALPALAATGMADIAADFRRLRRPGTPPQA